RRLRIRQLLLLILRTLLVVAIVLAFSRPAVHGSFAGFFGSRAATTMVLIVDDSPSMGVRSDRGVLFAQAKEEARRILGLAEEGDRAYLIPLSAFRRTEDFPQLRSGEAGIASLGSMEISQETLPFAQALRQTGKILAAAPNANEEVYLLTDAQATQFARGDTGRTLDARTRLFIVSPPALREENVGVAAVERTTQIVTVNRPVGLRAVVRNFGPAAVRSLTASVFLDGARVAQKLLDIPARASAVADFTVIPHRRGILQGAVDIDDDALEIDNRRAFVLNVPATISVLLAGGSASDTRYIAAALAPPGDSAAARVFSLRQVTETELPSTDFTPFDVVVVAGISRFDAAVADRLAQFVHGGGGAALFPGRESDSANENATLLQRLGIPPLAGPLVVGTGGSFLSFEKIDFAHPVFAGLFDVPPRRTNAPPAIESPKVVKTVVPAPGATGRTIIGLSDGSGFLTEYAPGAGRVFLFSVEAVPDWSDFPLKAIFAPLLHRSIMYLAAQDQEARDFIVGDRMTISVKVKNIGERTVYTLRSPSGIDDRIAPASVSATGMTRFEIAHPAEAGIYQLFSGDATRTGHEDAGAGLLGAFAVNVAGGESDLRQATAEDVSAWASPLGVQEAQVRRITDPGTIVAAVRESRYGVELWKYFVALAIALAIAEMIVGREPNRK
ncbi:MAG TPA: hypothetical protein VL126_07210, partial [Bacteroidota bacterium]|nr:hypothetical protein [Bacteroidota bacterium]